ncbi:MAG: ATP-binding protein [Bacteroidales bacterium]|nr:ATP-binding protein [Bacteroidales bacterium]
MESIFNKNIERNLYLEKVRPFYKQQLIKILTGQRRIGKSRLLLQIKAELENKYPKANFIFIDKEKYEFDDIRTYHELMIYVKEKSKSVLNFLFIDEIQEINDFEKALRSLLSEGNFDIYCTGSNTDIFSSKLATFLSGRQVEIKIHSLSYLEFLHFHKLENTNDSLKLYLEFGGLPYLIHLPKDAKIINEYLKNVLSTVLYKDVIGRNEIRDVAFLNDLLKFSADNTGSLLSAGSISKYLKSQRTTKSVSVIINYLNLLIASNLINRSSRMDIQGLKIFETGEKYYFEDIGLRNAVVGYKAQDINKIIENLVFNHLRIYGYDVFTGKSGDKEIDFIARKDNEIIYVQVAYKLTDEKVINREFGNLNQIKDHYPKYVVTMDEFPIKTSYKGIKHVKLIDFLSNADI